MNELMYVGPLVNTFVEIEEELRSVGRGVEEVEGGVAE